MSLVEAEEAIKEIDLRSRVNQSPTEPWLQSFTTVTRQDPAPGSRVFSGTEVTYEYELSQVSVPSVRGLTFDDAYASFEAHGLKLEPTYGQLTLRNGETPTAAGLVNVASEPSLVDAVDELGQSATADLAGEPFELRDSTVAHRWEVIDTESAGEGVIAGSILDATLAVPIAIVPRVIGLSTLNAVAAVRRAGLSAPDAAEIVFSGKLPKYFRFDLAYLANDVWGYDEAEVLEAKIGDPSEWLIVEQSVAGDQFLPAGKPLAMKAKWPVAKVPSLIGLTAEQGIRALNKVGLSAGDGSWEDSGLVRSQKPKAGTVLPMGARVTADIRHKLTFSVTSSSGSGLITWAAPGSFSIEQANGASLPWKKSWSPSSEPGAYEYGNFNAQMNSGSGWIKCTITLDGRVVSKSKSTGAYAVVSCG